MQTENSVPVRLEPNRVFLYIVPDDEDCGNGITFRQVINRMCNASSSRKIVLDICEHGYNLSKGEIRFSEGTKKHLKVWVQYGAQGADMVVPDRYTLIIDPNKLDDSNMVLCDAKRITVSLPYMIV